MSHNRKPGGMFLQSLEVRLVLVRFDTVIRCLQCRYMILLYVKRMCQLLSEWVWHSNKFVISTFLFPDKVSFRSYFRISPHALLLLNSHPNIFDSSATDIFSTFTIVLLSLLFQARLSSHSAVFDQKTHPSNLVFCQTTRN